MVPEVVKWRIWNLALRMNPQQAIYNTRVASGTVGVPDTFISYQLQRLVYRPAKWYELQLLDAEVSDQYQVWTITAVDLETATPLPPADASPPAPIPQASWTLTINGQTWIIVKVTPQNMNQSYECMCNLAR